MKKIVATFGLIATMFFSSIGHSAEEPNTYAPLEMATVTVRMSSGHPYGELYPCIEGCALRLLPFTKNAHVYLQGVLTSAVALQDGQELTGTVFLTTQPVDAIDQIVVK